MVGHEIQGALLGLSALIYCLGISALRIDGVGFAMICNVADFLAAARPTGVGGPIPCTTPLSGHW